MQHERSESESVAPGAAEAEQMAATTADEAGRPETEANAKVAHQALAAVVPSDAGATEASLKEALEQGQVTLQLLTKVRAWRSPRLQPDQALRAVADRYYEALAISFRGLAPEGSFSIYGHHIRAATQVQADKPLRIVVDSATLSFDWSLGRDLLSRLHVLDYRIRNTFGSALRSNYGNRSYSVVTAVLSSIDDEEGRHPPGDATQEPAEPSNTFKRELEHAAQRLGELEADVESAAQRRMQGIYAAGSGLGLLIILILAVPLGLMLKHHHVPATDAIAAATGAIGGAVSVMQRLTAGHLVVDTRARLRFLLTFGALRPALGAVFGMVVYLLLVGELVPAFQIPDDTNELAFVAVTGFIAGFNERFAQDMLAGAAVRMNGDGDRSRSRHKAGG